MLSFTSFDFNGIQESPSLDNYDKDAVVLKGKQGHMFGIEDLGEVNNPLCTEFGVYQENIAKKGLHLYKAQQQRQQQQQQQTKSNYLMFEEFHFNSCFPATTQPIQEITMLENFQTRSQELVKPNKEMPHPFAPTSLELLSNYTTSFKKMKGNQFSHIKNEPNVGSRKKLSTEEIMRVAGARYIQFYDQRYDDFSLVVHPFGHALLGLSEEETRDVELVHSLLAVAEKVGYQQYERASRLLSRCDWIASERANPVQRTVFCFAEALRERIDLETGRITPKELGATSDADQGLGTSLTSVLCHQHLPFVQVMQFSGIQAIIENVATASKVHMIDLEIRSGVQWTVTMQALAEREQRPVELLKITAVGLEGKQTIEETGKRLVSVAESMNLPFSFNAVYVSDMSDIKEELFEIGDGEAVVIYSQLMLRTMISRPSCLENLMRVIKNINPSIMVVIEVEANHNSPSFVNRFIEAQFFYSAFFDCLETCYDQNIELRTMTESILFNGIRNIVAMEGHDRFTRNVKMDVWRAFFSRFRMMEIGFSDSSLYQANLVAKQFPCGSSCTLEKNGKSLIVGWKGTPIHSLSAWKFSREREAISKLQILK